MPHFVEMFYDQGAASPTAEHAHIYYIITIHI